MAHSHDISLTEADTKLPAGMGAMGPKALIAGAVLLAIGFFVGGADHFRFAYLTGFAFWLTIALGMIWAKPTWGVWWTWDARLTLTAIMFFVYLGYLALRRAISDPVARARRSSILGMLAIVQVPIVHFSVIWWRGLHQPPTVIRPDEMQIDGILLAAVWVGVVAFTLVYASLVRRRMLLSRIEDDIEATLRSDTRPVAGDAVARPAVLGREAP